MNSMKYDYKKGLAAMTACYFIWGFQPLYFSLDKGVDTTFLLACRILWAAVCCLTILWAQGKLGELKAVFLDRKVMMREIPAAVLLFADWSIYFFAIRMGKVMECSMGYYIMPLVMFAFGALIFREKVRGLHFAALAFIIVGIVLSVSGFGGFPYVTVLLSLCFAVYSAVKKSLTVDSIVSTTAEIIMMTPVALIYICLFGRGEGALQDMTVLRQLFILGSGIITGMPMVFFAIGIAHLPLSLTGIFQYLSPTLGLVCSLIMGESFSKGKLLSFAFIWAGVIIYSACELKNNRARQTGGAELEQ